MNATKRPNFFQTFWRFKKIRIFIYILLAFILIFTSSFYLITRVFSTPAINYPKTTHFHFRQSITLNGKEINFSEDKFQVPVTGVGCDIKLAEEPIHFHDKNGQFVHVHWEGITGGQVLKNYGINYIGGLDDSLGFRLDNGHFLQNLKVHGQFFNKNEYSNKNLYIYVGKSDDFSKKEKNDFLHKPLSEFFGKGATTTSFFNSIQVNADDGSHSTPSPAGEKVLEARQKDSQKYQGKTDEEVKKELGIDDKNLKELNNVLGDLVIFIEDKEPTNEQIKAKFNSLQPLPVSICGG